MTQYLRTVGCKNCESPFIEASEDSPLQRIANGESVSKNLISQNMSGVDSITTAVISIFCLSSFKELFFPLLHTVATKMQAQHKRY